MPRYTHDCDQCVYLGEYRHDGRDYDLWHCKMLGITVARYGDSPSEDVWCEDDMEDSHPALAFARVLARGKGLITKECKP